jgi:hypothetical protein
MLDCLQLSTKNQIPTKIKPIKIIKIEAKVEEGEILISHLSKIKTFNDRIRRVENEINLFGGEESCW